ncbi:SDR family oxidoreductase [Nocardioides sp. Kera G14]|uniref:SDR family oxidoreductase n=1 Tax=Nocardioides sp. Kera G14 TaxID=2884264 RepID=UPI001D125504|nr:3-beta hydroxysteroid dehydrogenase [Nocardioides sp. Kera G14]UDY23536.1 3-beta hydroxysteroid dehydrogenase [Nocardioides sp. Kera G14]
MRIAVAGGTGWTGRLVVAALKARGDEAVVLARSVGVDLRTGAGLAERLVEVDAVIDVTNIGTQSAKRSIDFFHTVTSTLLEAERRAAVRHHVALSIVGVTRVDLGYYLGKRCQEDLVLHDDHRGTVLRATQFHEFAAQMLARKGPFVIAPRMLCQPVAVAEVADHLVELAHGSPIGLAPELAGPEEHLRMEDMVRRLARARRVRRPVVPIAFPGSVGRGLTGGGLLPTASGPRGTITFDEWLASEAAR